MAKRNTFSEDEIYDEKFDINQVKRLFYESDGRLYSDGNGWNEADFRLRCGNPSDNGVRHDQLKTENPLYEPYRAEYRA